MGILLAKQNRLLDACCTGKVKDAETALCDGKQPKLRPWNRKAEVDVFLPDTGNSLVHIAAMRGSAAVVEVLAGASAPL